MLTDSELANKVLQMKNRIPDAGEKLIIGWLKSMGYSVTRARVQDISRSTTRLLDGKESQTKTLLCFWTQFPLAYRFVSYPQQCNGKLKLKFRSTHFMLYEVLISCPITVEHRSSKCQIDCSNRVCYQLVSALLG